MIVRIFALHGHSHTIHGSMDGYTDRSRGKIARDAHKRTKHKQDRSQILNTTQECLAARPVTQLCAIIL